MTASVIYTANLRCEATHIQSGTMLQTDAPTDNRGKGERFSPTDLLCVSLATCIVTTMAIKAGDMALNLSGTKLSVTKIMLADPRRVGKIEIDVHFPAGAVPEEKDRDILQRTGDNCPVAKSLHTDLEISVKYRWG